MSQCTGVDKIWSALYSSGALAEREVENKIGHAFSTFAVVVLALGHFAKLADCGFATIYLIKNVLSKQGWKQLIVTRIFTQWQPCRK